MGCGASADVPKEGESGPYVPDEAKKKREEILNKDVSSRLPIMKQPSFDEEVLEMMVRLFNCYFWAVGEPSSSSRWEDV